MNYRLLIDYEVIEFLETLSRREHGFCRNRLVAIRDDPQKIFRLHRPDHTGRRVDIHICGRYAVKFCSRITPTGTKKFSTCIWPTMCVVKMKLAIHQYDNIDGKLRQLGASIQRVEEK